MQAPIPGREAFWDMDTPETKRLVKFLLPKWSYCQHPLKVPRVSAVQITNLIDGGAAAAP